MDGLVVVVVAVILDLDGVMLDMSYSLFSSEVYPGGVYCRAALRGEVHSGAMCTLSLPLGYGGMNPERSGGMNPLD